MTHPRYARLLLATLYVRSRTVGDGSRRFDVKYRRGGRYTSLLHAGTFKTKREAEIRARVVGEWLAEGKDPRVELARTVSVSRTVSDLHSEWIASRRRVASGTVDGYRFRRVVIDDAFGGRSVESLTHRDVIEWVARLEESYKPGTVRLFVTQFRMILDFHGGLNVARDRRVELPRDVRSEPDPPDAPEVVDMLQAIRGDMLLPVLTMELAGLRVTETMTLHRDDVDAGAGTLRVRREAAKGQRFGRTVPVPDVLADVLTDALPFRGNRSRVRDAMRAVSTINPHALRHRRATLWYQQGVGAVELARRLGHARPSMSLDVYAHVKPLREVDHAVVSTLLR